ncbi:uncharacterized protein A4U43_C03F13400 [Asparagus officinalis]|uniref:Uncharacterized protein n=1 Tax=Asparagus officinalis TaxID=4686 RepID=A0A5P1F9R3_ASPOF|nr:uncharacterized protein A4U43_C03F13400 [Asparagus officinalis]
MTYIGGGGARGGEIRGSRGAGLDREGRALLDRDGEGAERERRGGGALLGLGSPATERERRGIVAALLVFECRGSERDRPERDRRNGGIWGEIWGSFSGLEDLSLGEEEDLRI